MGGSRLLQDEVSHSGFKIPVDHRERGQVERSVRSHQHKDPARDGEDRSVHQPADHGLFGAGEPGAKVEDSPKSVMEITQPCGFWRI